MKVIHAGLLAAVACLMLVNFAFSADPVTFAKDVAPILQEKCQECHHTGSMAPMSLVTYEEARPWAKTIRDRVTARRDGIAGIRNAREFHDRGAAHVLRRRRACW